MRCGRRGFTYVGVPICILESGHTNDCVPEIVPIVPREQQLEKEIAELKLRIAHLENGVGVLEAADAYAKRQADYAAQVERLAAAVLQMREALLRHEQHVCPAPLGEIRKSTSEAMREPFIGIEVPGKK